MQYTNEDKFEDVVESFPLNSEDFDQIEKTLNDLEPALRFLSKCREWILFPYRFSQN